MSERVLWLSVLLQVVQDIRYDGAKKDALREAENQLHYLNTNRQSFYMVCKYAGIPPEPTREALKELLTVSSEEFKVRTHGVVRSSRASQAQASSHMCEVFGGAGVTEFLDTINTINTINTNQEDT